MFGFLFLSFLYSGFLTTCSAGEGHLYVSNGTHILRMSRFRGVYEEYESVYHQIGGIITGLTADVDRELLFWVDIGKNHNAIFRSKLDGTRVNIIVRGVYDCHAVSVDWIAKHIYWTNGAHKTVEIANYDGSGRRILIGQGLTNPRGIIVDPVFGYVFWADQGSKKIEAAWLDGTNRKVLVDREISWPNQMAVSYSTRRLYWVDSKKQTIMSCDVESGGDVTVERRVSEASEGNPVFGLAVVGNKAFISTWFNAKISSTYVAIREAFWREEIRIPESLRLYSLFSTASAMQTPSFHVCGQPDKGGCTHLCLPTKGPSYNCACPTYGGLALSFNAKTCEAPSEPLFFTLKEWGNIGFISLSGAQSSYLTMVGRSSKPSAVTYDPIKQVVYWSDVEEAAIYRSSLAGNGEKEVFLNGSHGIGIVEGLALDWKSRKLYFTNMGQSTPGLDGAVYSWHRLEKISLDKKDRKTVVEDVERPSGVALDLEKGFLYYSDWSKRPRIVRVLMDGYEPTVILDKGLSNPTGLSFYDGRLYVADSHHDNKTGAPHLMVYDGESNEWTQLKLSSNVSLPMGLAVRGDTMYYTDWVSSDNHLGYIKSYNLRFGVDNNLILSGGRPTGVHYSPLARRKSESDSKICEKSPCSHNCIQLPESNAYKCECPDQSTLVLSSNKATCARPQNFLLMADLNTIKVLSLDEDTQEKAQTLWYSDITANYVALTYDDLTDTVYWSDLTRKSIYFSPIMDFKPQPLIQVDHYIDGLALDSDKQRLYWTGYSSNGSGIIARLNIQRGVASYHEILRGLNNPRAIHLHSEKKLIFWTEYGGKNSPACVKKARANGRNPKMLMSNGLFWPNALATHQQKLYIADGAGKAFVVDFYGEGREELTFLTGSTKHIFGLVVMDTVLFYSDWFTNSVYMVDRITGYKEAVVSHLSRPTNIFVYHPANLTENNKCMREGQKCAESCVPVPRSYHCTCSVGSKLAADGFSCIKMTSPWQVTEESKCFNQCDENAYCSQLVPLLKYQCVCKAGYESYDGKGFRCTECGEDFFKPLLGNDTCVPCPLGSSSQGSTTASLCFCNKPDHRLVNGFCTNVTTSTTTTMTLSQGTSDFDGGDEFTTDAPIWSTGILPPGQPYYEYCPHGETMKMTLSEDQGYIWLPVDWVARDGFGKKLPSISNFEQKDNQIYVPWVANGDAGIHTVIFEAKDDWRQSVTCQFQILLEDNTPPKFTSCPQNIYQETVMKSEPISWPMPVAIDNVNTRKLHSSYEPKSEFSIGTTMVKYEAYDPAGNKAVCTFNVTLVQDNIPPKFTSCPQNIYQETVMKSEPISWPMPVAIDNVNTPKLHSSYEPKSEFTIGTTMVKYEAYDLAGNKAVCTFNVTLVQAEQPCNLTDFKNGAFLCSNSDKDFCYIVCNKNFIVNPLWNFPKSFNCADGSSVKALNKLFSSREPCLANPKPTSAREVFSLTLQGDCRPEDNDLKRKLKSKIIDRLERKQLCLEANCTHGTITITCIHKIKKRRRYAEEKFNMSWPVTITLMEGLSRGKVSRIVTDLKLELKKMTTHLTLLQSQYMVLPGSVGSKEFQWMCGRGQMVIDDGCVSCPPGSYYNKTTRNCRLCGEGFYQNSSSQERCVVCGWGTTEENGAISESECVTFPSINRMSKFIIIAACSVAFVFLCLVLFLFSQYKHQQKKAKTQMNNVNNKYPSPNVYAQAPPPKQSCPDYIRSSKDFFINNHDYEDLDGHHRSTFETFSRRPPGCRDSLSSFKSPTDITFLPSPPEPNGHSSFFSNDPHGTPISLREGSRSMSLHGEPFQYNSLGSFKGSPPPSPYRSLHMAANGPIPRGPESPTNKAQTLNSLFGDESPYTSRLIRDRLIDPDSPYRIISSDRRTPGPDSPYKKPRMDNESPYRMTSDYGSMNRMSGKESPYRSPLLNGDSMHSYRTTPEMHRAHHVYPHVTDPQNSLRSVPESPSSQHQIFCSIDELGPSEQMGDFLYKRPPSPLSPPLSSKKSTDSLNSSPSIPRASPGMTRKQMNFHRTPPQKRRVKNEFGIYEYD